MLIEDNYYGLRRMHLSGNPWSRGMGVDYAPSLADTARCADIFMDEGTTSKYNLSIDMLELLCAQSHARDDVFFTDSGLTTMALGSTLARLLGYSFSSLGVLR